MQRSVDHVFETVRPPDGAARFEALAEGARRATARLW